MQQNKNLIQKLCDAMIEKIIFIKINIKIFGFYNKNLIMILALIKKSSF